MSKEFIELKNKTIFITGVAGPVDFIKGIHGDK